MSKTFAIIFGLNYLNQDDLRLDGCINDSRLMEKFLNKYLNIPNKDIDVYNDYSNVRPNKVNMLKIITEGIDKVNKNYDRLWIHFSGHGIQVYDSNNDENDYNDEALVPLDRYNNSDCIIDDDLNTLFSKIQKNKTLVCIFDCCHSGSLLDLPYRYNYIGNSLNSDFEKNLDNDNNNIKCPTYLFSGCQDKEFSYDGIELGSKYSYTGAFSATFLKIAQNHSRLTFDYLIEETYKFLKNNKYEQTPQITTNQSIDKNTIFIESENWSEVITKIKIYYIFLKILLQEYKKTLNINYLSKIIFCKNYITELLLV